MKRLLAVLLFLAAVGSAAFAEITWSGNGRFVFVPFGVRFANTDKPEGTNTGHEVQTYLGSECPWDGDGVRIQLGLKASRPENNMGFDLAINLERLSSGKFAFDDNKANVWISPFGGIFETLKLTAGMFQVDDLRYNKIVSSGSGFHNYIWYVRSDITDEDATFARFHSQGFGTHLAWEPLAGLWFGWQLPSVGNSRSFAGELKDDGWINAIANSQIGVGYTIENIGRARLQFIGARPKIWDEASSTGGWVDAIDVPTNKSGDAHKIQVAFNYIGVPGFNLDVGASIPIPYERDYWDNGAKTNKTETKTVQEDMVISLGFDLTKFNPFRLWFTTSIKFAGYTETETYVGAGSTTTTIDKGTNWALHITPMYTVAPNNIVGLDLFIDVRDGSDESATNHSAPIPDNDPTLNPAADAKNNFVDLGFGVYYRRNIAGGDIRVGLTMKVPGVGGEAHEGAQPQLFLPIMFNYSF